MLQPMQILDVSSRYENEIVDLRGFLAQAGLTLDAADTLRSMNAQLRDDRAFRRDLTSHAWVVLHAGGQQVRHADLLAMLAIAAAGPGFAAEAADSEAHDLLRFVMQVWSSFHTSPGTAQQPTYRPVASAIVAPVQPYWAAEDTGPVTFTRSAPPGRESSGRESSFSLTMPDDGDGQRRIAWISAAACILLAVFAGLFFFRHHAATHSGTAAPVVASTAQEVAPVLATRSQQESQVQGIAANPSAARREARSAPYSRLSENPLDLSETGTSRRAKPAPGIAVPVSRPVPASGRPSSRSSSRNSYVSRAKPVAVAGNGSSYVPSVMPVENFRSGGGSVSAGTSRQAVVRPTSLGIMAANVTYSPAPVYPAAASAARVQGEVKLEAEVGRDGTVASTRIISGPPLLADAAADAVQRWRYRPYLYEGKPIAMNAQIVMDFQLP